MAEWHVGRFILEPCLDGRFLRTPQVGPKRASPPTAVSLSASSCCTKDAIVDVVVSVAVSP